MTSLWTWVSQVSLEVRELSRDHLSSGSLAPALTEVEDPSLSDGLSDLCAWLSSVRTPTFKHRCQSVASGFWFSVLEVASRNLLHCPILIR